MAALQFQGGLDHVISAHLRYLDGQTLINPLILLPQINILSPQLLNFLLDLMNNLIFLIHLNNRLIPNIHRPCRIVQSGEGLIEVGLGRARAGDHQGFRVSSN